MRNKKYRSWALIFILLVAAIVAFSMLALSLTQTEKILLIVCGIVFVAGIIFLFPLYLEIKDDRIVTNLGVSSLEKEYRGIFKKHVFMFDDLRDIYRE